MPMRRPVSTFLMMATLALSPAMSFAADDAAPAASQAPSATPAHHHGMHEAWSKLPDDKKAALKAAMKKAEGQNAPLKNQLKDLSKDLKGILSAPTFDKDAYLKKNAQIEQVHFQMKQNRDAAFADAVADFTPAERASFPVGRGWQHHGKRHHSGTKDAASGNDAAQPAPQ